MNDDFCSDIVLETLKTVFLPNIFDTGILKLFSLKK